MGLVEVRSWREAKVMAGSQRYWRGGKPPPLTPLATFTFVARAPRTIKQAHNNDCRCGSVSSLTTQHQPRRPPWPIGTPYKHNEIIIECRDTIPWRGGCIRFRRPRYSRLKFQPSSAFAFAATTSAFADNPLSHREDSIYGISIKSCPRDSFI